MKINRDELRQAFERVQEEKTERMLEDCGGEEMDKWIEDSMRKLDCGVLYQEAQSSGRPLFRWRWTRGAAAVLAVLVLGTVSVYAVEKIRQAEVQWEVDFGKREDDFHFEARNPAETAPPEDSLGEKMPEKIERRYKPSYIPEGFEEYGEDRQDVTYRVTYMREKERLYFEQFTKTGATTADLELSEQKTVEINGYEGQIGYEEDQMILQFENGHYVFRFTLKGQIEWDEMIHMAGTVAKLPPDLIEEYYEPAYVPEGFEDTGEDNYDDVMIYRYYKNNECSIVFGQSTLGGELSVDSEKMQRTTVDINGWKGQLNEKKKKKKKILVWATNEYSFKMFGNGEIESEELLKMARSLECASGS